MHRLKLGRAEVDSFRVRLEPFSLELGRIEIEGPELFYQLGVDAVMARGVNAVEQVAAVDDSEVSWPVAVREVEVTNGHLLLEDARFEPAGEI